MELDYINVRTETPGPEWIWVDIDLLGLKLEMPSDWVIQQVDDPLDICGLGHDLADYTLFSDEGDRVTIITTCGILDEQIPADCPGNLVRIDENRQIGRVKILGFPNPVYTKYFTSNAGMVYCPIFGWKIRDYWVSAQYGQSNSDYNYQVVDRIILSIQEK
jgi:hypothetical protein